MDKDELQWLVATPGERISLNQGHIWRANLDLPEIQLESMLAILSADELERASRFQFKKHKNRYIITRAILRKVLGGYLGKKPNDLKFEYTDKGKPVLPTNTGYDNLCFNLSHSHTVALFAFTPGKNIGIDIECLREDLAILPIARRFFSPGEISSLESLSKGNMHELFFQYWTRKEAFLKATGEGITFPMEKVDVSLISGKILSPVTLIGDEGQGLRWFVQDLFPGKGYAAAVAVAEGQCDLSYLHYKV